MKLGSGPAKRIELSTQTDQHIGEKNMAIVPRVHFLKAYVEDPLLRHLCKLFS